MSVCPSASERVSRPRRLGGLSARVPTIEPHHIGGDCRFVDKYKVGGVKQPLLADPASARPSHVGALALTTPTVSALFGGPFGQHLLDAPRQRAHGVGGLALEFFRQGLQDEQHGGLILQGRLHVLVDFESPEATRLAMLEFRNTEPPIFKHEQFVELLRSAEARIRGGEIQSS
jgi:hypothetical protein